MERGEITHAQTVGLHAGARSPDPGGTLRHRTRQITGGEHDAAEPSVIGEESASRRMVRHGFLQDVSGVKFPLRSAFGLRALRLRTGRDFGEILSGRVV